MPDESLAPLFTPEWVSEFTERYGIVPIAGGEAIQDGGGEDTPTPEADGPQSDEAPITDSPAPSEDYEKRYNDLRPQYDRTMSRNQELEQFLGALADPQTQAQALAALGLEVAGDDDDDDDDFDYEDPDERIDRIEQFISQREAEAENAEILKLEQEYVTEAIKEITKAENIDLSAEERKLVETLAKHPEMRDEDGIPDVEAAFAEFKAATEANLGRYRSSKRAPSVELGQAGTDKINLNDDDARIEATAAIIQAEREAERS